MNGRFVSLKKSILMLILLASGTITTIVTLFSLYYNYRGEVKMEDLVLKNIEASSLGPLTNAVFNVDESQIQKIADGTLAITDAVEVRVSDEFNKEILLRIKPPVDFIEESLEGRFYNYHTVKTWKLVHDGVTVGSFEVTLTRAYMYARLVREGIFILWSQLLKTILISVIIVFMLKKMVTHRIETIHQYWTDHDLRTTISQDPLQDRESGETYNEIDELINRTNEVFGRLRQANRESQRELDYQRIQMQRAMSLVNLSHLAASIAHEINNPLAIILGYSEIISRKLPQEVGKETVLLTMVKRIEKTTRRIEKITKGLLVFARDRRQEQIEAASLDSLVHEALAMASTGDPSKKVNIQFTGSQDISTIGCRSELIESLVNIFRNALQAAVSDSNPKVIIFSEVRNDKIFLRVSNSGVKIDGELQKKMSTPFFTTKSMGDEDENQGLGLSLALALVEANQGCLYYDPSFPMTTFVFELPLHKESITDQKMGTYA